MEGCIIDLLKSSRIQNEISGKNDDNVYPYQVSNAQSGNAYQVQIQGYVMDLVKFTRPRSLEFPFFVQFCVQQGRRPKKSEKFCNKLLKSITTNKYTIKDLLLFAKEVEEFVMASFDVKSIFTNTSLAETIGLFVENLYRNQIHFDSLSKSSFCRL